MLLNGGISNEHFLKPKEGDRSAPLYETSRTKLSYKSEIRSVYNSSKRRKFGKIENLHYISQEGRGKRVNPSSRRINKKENGHRTNVRTYTQLKEYFICIFPLYYY